MSTKSTNSEETNKSSESRVLRFFVTLIWVILATVFSIGGAILMVGHDYESFFSGNSNLGYLGIALPLLFFIVTFCVPYLRKKGTTTRWCGLVLLGDAIWWIYLLISQS